jgi:hypothetical protein
MMTSQKINDGCAGGKFTRFTKDLPKRASNQSKFSIGWLVAQY